MALTPKQLIDELAKTGRIVKPRTLTDWRTRGLLPKLKDKGRGPGKGKIQYWIEHDILDQAAFVFDLPSWDTPQIIFALWCCGFKVQPALLRDAWLKEIERLSWQLTRQDLQEAHKSATQTYFDLLADSTDKWANLAKKVWNAQGYSFPLSAHELAQRLLEAIFDSVLKIDLGGAVLWEILKMVEALD
jgi:hypothetical protein